VVAVPITDPAERELPRVGLVDLEDMETGERITVEYVAARAAQALRRPHARHGDAPRPAVHDSSGIDCIALRTDEDFTPKLHKFFQLRARRFH
jgi:hypothetical protein